MTEIRTDIQPKQSDIKYMWVLSGVLTNNTYKTRQYDQSAGESVNRKQYFERLPRTGIAKTPGF